MAKDTNTLKCPELARGSKKLGCVIRVDKFMSNDGFLLTLDAVLTGFNLTRDEVTQISNFIVAKLHSKIDSIISDKLYSSSQFELPF